MDISSSAINSDLLRSGVSSKSDLHQSFSIAHRKRMKTATWAIQRLALAGRGATAAASAGGGGGGRGRGTPATKRFYTRGEFPKGMRMIELALKNSEKRWEQEISGALFSANLPETVAIPSLDDYCIPCLCFVLCLLMFLCLCLVCVHVWRRRLPPIPTLNPLSFPFSIHLSHCFSEFCPIILFVESKKP
jgi:hypothetical protein